MGFPGNSIGKESTCNAGDPGSIPGLGRSPGEEKGYQYSGNTPVFCPGEFHGLYSPWGHKSRTRLSDFHFHFTQQLRKVGTINMSYFTDEELKQRHSATKG